MNISPRRQRALALLSSIVLLACSSPTTGSAPPNLSQLGPCHAKDCAGCLQGSGEVCIWCSASASCEEWPSACPSGPDTHGYFSSNPFYSSITAPQAAAICALPCALNGELLSNKSGATLNAEPCCSSSQPTSGTNGSACSPSNAGEHCVVDDDCISPETCNAGACVGSPAVEQVACNTAPGQCFCTTEFAPVGSGPDPVECSTNTLPDSVCCAASGWPQPDPKSGGTCQCWSLTCAYTSGPIGGPGNCGCGAAYANYPKTMSSCSGQLCCSNPAASFCGCEMTASPGDTCESRFGVGTVQVSSCSTSSVGCAPKYHTVSSCSAGTPR